MSEQHVYIYVKERDHVISDEQKEKAFSLFDENIIECEHEPYFDTVENLELTYSDIIITSPFMMTAGDFVATNRFWQLDDNNNEKFGSDINETISIRPEILQELENILGTKVAVVWEHRD
ncbi:hypothetical protein [Psychrobacter alimentarius]|uniref:hypothetical protein n=1 Tax=Psychrobacter alimentarius TaxID=261164 RepID=UPI0019193EC2|nr:hypothetical protein [Psychrobacter alimentarius]